MSAPDTAGAADQLRQLTREAHGAAKDLRAAIKEARQYRDEIISAWQRLANAEIGELRAHLQREMNRSAADLNAAVNRARDHIVSCLTPAQVKLSAEHDAMIVTWKGRAFDPDVPVPGDPP